MSFVACGLSHKTAPIDIRERFYFPKEKIAESLRDLKKRVLVNDAVILSTCNRTEIYCSSVSHPQALSDWLARHHNIIPEDLAPHMYTLKGEESVKHVFRVASGMDSMVLGEPQIFGQLKEAVSIAEKTGTLNGAMKKFFDHAFYVGKKIRTETDIGLNPVSLGQVIFHLIREKINKINQAKILFIGVGEMTRAVLGAIKPELFKDICIANRTFSAAQKLAETVGGQACDLKNISKALVSADIIISAAAGAEFIINTKDMKNTLKHKKQKNILLFDLGVPRNIDPEIKKLEKTNKKINLYSLDDLSEILDKNRLNRLNSARTAEAIIDCHTKQFILSLKSLKVADAVKKYRTKMEDIRDECLQQAIKKLNKKNSNPEKTLEKLAHQITNKFLHAPSVNIKKAACQEDWILIHAIEKLWEL